MTPASIPPLKMKNGGRGGYLLMGGSIKHPIP